MVGEITLLPEFTPGFVEIKDKIPKFQYRKSLAARTALNWRKAPSPGR